MRLAETRKKSRFDGALRYHTHTLYASRRRHSPDPYEWTGTNARRRLYTRRVATLKQAGRASERRRERRGRKVSERRGKRKRGTRVGRRRDTGKMYAHAHASVAERSRIVLLFNSDRVIDLARLSCVRTYIYARLGNTRAYTTTAPAAGGNARESIRQAGSEMERESIV